MNDKDYQNEGIGIIAIIIIVFLAAIGLYFFFSSHRPATALAPNNSVPLEAPAPVSRNAGT
jgi:flagellar basal body-associated protein FliL